MHEPFTGFGVPELTAAAGGPSFHEQLVDNLYDGVYYVDSARVITYWNKGAEALTGYSAQEAVHRPCFANFLNHVDEQGQALCLGGCPLASTLEDGQKRQAEVYLQHKDGHRIPVSVRVAPIWDGQGNVVGAVEVFSDNSAKKRVERRAVHWEKLAFKDPLTNLGNRRFTELKINQAIQEAKEFSRNIGVLFIDLDHFKKVNDDHGHEVGDLALQTVSRTLSLALRPGDTVGRWGGEEFLAIVADLSAEELLALAERCRKLIAQSSTPCGTSKLYVTASIGCSLIVDGDSAPSLLSRVDQLMYRSKAGGRNQVSFG